MIELADSPPWASIFSPLASESVAQLGTVGSTNLIPAVGDTETRRGRVSVVKMRYIQEVSTPKCDLCAVVEEIIAQTQVDEIEARLGSLGDLRA